jgi:CRP-like cAMP-binding protein
VGEQGGWSEDQLIQLLGEVELFRGLPREDLFRIASAVHGAVVPSGKWIFEEGEPGDAFYIVFGGAVEILKAGRGGQHERLAVRRRGEGFGEMSLLNSAPRSAGARTTEETQLIVLRQNAFLELLGGDGIAVRLLQNFSTALRALNVRFASLERAAKGSVPDAEMVSRTLQRGMIPKTPPRLAGYEVAGGTILYDDGPGQSAWDWVTLDGGTLALTAMEVRNPGLPAACFLGQARVALRAVAPSALGPRDLLMGASGPLAQAQIPGVNQFVECGVLVPNPGQLLWGCAGSMFASVIRKDGTVEELRSHGPALGVMPSFGYRDSGLSVSSGDVALVLSGGSEGLFRGTADLAVQLHGKPAVEVVATIQKAIRKSAGEDDHGVSILYVRRH